MKILFTADWHIKLGQKNVPVEWQSNRFGLFYKKLLELANAVDIVIIGGDTFDKLPNLNELELFYKFLLAVRNFKGSAEFIIYSGNHEAVKKSTTFLSVISESIEVLSGGKVKLIDDYASYKGIDFIPYNRLAHFHKTGYNSIEFTNNILCTHVRGEIPPHVTPEVPLELFEAWDMVLAGDLHSHSNTQRNIVYPGSPMTTSFHRSEVDTGVVIVDTEVGEYEFIDLGLPQLLRKTVTSPEEMVETKYHHTIYELEGALTDLAKVQGTELLDKKIVKRPTTSALNIKQGMTIQEELAEYLAAIVGLPDAEVRRVTSALNDYIKEVNVE